MDYSSYKDLINFRPKLTILSLPKRLKKGKNKGCQSDTLYTDNPYTDNPYTGIVAASDRNDNKKQNFVSDNSEEKSKIILSNLANIHHYEYPDTKFCGVK